jgi:hypothetical protein
MTTQNIFSILVVLLVFSSALTGAVGTVAASPSDVQFQQETPTTTPQANNSTNSTTTPTATPSDDFANSNDSGNSDVQVESGGESDSPSNESNSTAAGDDEPPFDPENASYEYTNGLLLHEEGHGEEEVTFTVYNPTDSEVGVVWYNGNDEGEGFYLDAGESRRVTVPTSGNILQQQAVVATVVEDVESFDGKINYAVGYQPLVINGNPAGDLGPLIGVIGGVVVLLMFIGSYKFNHRVGKMAIALTGQSSQRVYQDELVERNDSYRKQTKDIIDGVGIIAVVVFNWAIGVFAFWDMYPIAWFFKLISGFGRLYDPSTLVTLAEVYSNLMVYWAYNVVILGIITYYIGVWFLKRKGIELEDIDPAVGNLDFASWLLSPKRWADLRVFKKMVDDDGNEHDVEIDKKRLKEVNHNSVRKSYAVSDYYPRKNVCFVVMEDVDPSELARAEKKFQQAEFFRSIAKAIQDDVWGLVKRQARKLQAESTARLEGELMEGAEQRDKWMHEELSESEYEEVATGEKSLEQELYEQHGEVEGLTDSVSNSNSNQSSQTAGDSR